MKLHHFQIDYLGHSFSGVFEFEDGYKGDDECPPYDSIVTILEIYINDSKIDASDVVSPKVIQHLESIIREDLP